MNFFNPIQSWEIPQNCFLDSLSEMAIDGVQGNEGVVLWLGTRNKGHAVVTHLVFLRGKGIIKQPDLLTINSSLVNDVTDVTIDLHVTLLGQIHSHGPTFGTNLSRTDKLYGFAIPFYLSVVAPHYALKPGTTLNDCGVHVFIPGYGYQRLSPEEVKNRVRVTPGIPTTNLIVSGN